MRRKINVIDNACEALKSSRPYKGQRCRSLSPTKERVTTCILPEASTQSDSAFVDPTPSMYIGASHLWTHLSSLKTCWPAQQHYLLRLGFLYSGWLWLSHPRDNTAFNEGISTSWKYRHIMELSMVNVTSLLPSGDNPSTALGDVKSCLPSHPFRLLIVHPYPCSLFTPIFPSSLIFPSIPIIKKVWR